MQPDFSPDFVIRRNILPCVQLQAASTQLKEIGILGHHPGTN